MRWRCNPFFDSEERFPAANPAVRRFHESLAGYRPTPLASLPGLARELGVGSILVKDELHRFGLKAFKALGASWAVHQFLERNGTRPVTFASATDGNHGRAVAWAARQTHQRAVIYVPRHTVAARMEAIRGEGAEVVVVDGTYDDAVHRADADSRAHGWQVISDMAYPGCMGIPAWVTEGYSTLFVEIDAQMAETDAGGTDVVVVQAGIGGLAAAAVQHFLNTDRRRRPVVVCVQPTEADGLLESASSADGEPRSTRASQRTMMAGLACGTPSLTAWPVLKRGVTLFLSIDDRFAAEAMRRLYFPVAGDARVVAGESGAAGLAGLMALLRAPGFEAAASKLGIAATSSVLVINSEGDTDPANFQRVIDGAS